MLTNIVVFEGAINEFVNQPGGPVSLFLGVVAETQVIPDAVLALSVPAIRVTSYRLGDDSGPDVLAEKSSEGFSESGLVRNTWAPNPPEGPPRERTRDLINSLEVVIEPDPGRGVAAFVVARATHGGFDYPAHLRARGYKFLPLNDPKYIYVDIP